MTSSPSANDDSVVAACDVAREVEAQSLSSSERYSEEHGIDRETDDKLAAIWKSMQGKLFERDAHQKLLKDAYCRTILGDVDTNATGQNASPRQVHPREVILITGPSGTGKSFLARSIYEVASQDNVYILYGKCDFQQTNEPLAPLVHAFSALVEEILARGQTDPSILATAHEALAKATHGLDVEFLTGMIPAFAKLLPPGTEETKESKSEQGGEAIRRATITRPNADTPGIAILCNFLRQLCSNCDFRVLIFIDDLQWLDAKSIQLFRGIASSDKLQRCMLLGTCRGNEVGVEAELAEMLRTIEDEGVKITDIQVENLRLESICGMLQELLHVEKNSDISSLAFLAFRLTNGNPFFVVELMRSLLADQLLLLDATGKWVWNEAEILGSNQCLENAEISDAIVQGLIRDDADPMRETLQIAACLGAQFSSQHVKNASSQPKVVSRALQVLVYRRIILTTKVEGMYHWSHDRFQASAFNLIPEEEQMRFKCQIALHILSQFTQEDLVENVFLVAGLLFGGEDLFETDEDKQNISELYYIAGVKASQSSAFEEAAVYFRKGIELLPRDHWERKALYSICQQLYNSLAEMECCLGNTAEVESLCGMILKHSTSLQDQTRAYDTRIYSLSYCNRMNESVDVALEVLRKLGEKVPYKVGLFLNIKELITTRRLLNGMTADDILCLPLLQDWKKVSALQIINIVFPAVLRSRPDYALFLTAKAIKITLRHGLSPLSAVLFSMFSMILCNPIGAIEEGLRIEDIGYRIFEKFQAHDLRSRMLVIRYAYAQPWTASIQDCFPHLLAGASAGMMTGDFEMAFISSFVHCIDSILAGSPLEQHYEAMQRVKERYTPLGQETVMFYLDAAIQLSLNLLGLAENVHVLTGNGFDEETSLQFCIDTNNAAGLSFILLPKLFLALFTEDYNEAVIVARRLEKSANNNLTAFDVQYVSFLSALSEMIMARQTKKKKFIRAGNRALKRLENATRHCQGSYWVNRIRLVEAERDAFNGMNKEAFAKFFLSIEMANKHGWTHEEALAYERVGLLHSETAQTDKARECFRKARDLYEKWGCVIKHKRLSDLCDGHVESARQ